jgi:hypothetical protein
MFAITGRPTHEKILRPYLLQGQPGEERDTVSH